MSDDNLPPIERATLHLYQLYDLADSIDLERARAVLTAPTARMRPVVTRGASIVMAQLPLVLNLGPETLTLPEVSLRGRLTARIYDLGILALCLIVDLPADPSWDQVTDYIATVQNAARPPLDCFTRAVDTLKATLEAAITGSNAIVRTEDYTILVIDRLAAGIPASRLGRHPGLLRATLGERRPLSSAAAALATPLSYYDDDLILLTWSAAIVIEPDETAREDATFLLEFANVQLLAFRSYDAQIEDDLVRIAPRIAARRRPRWWLLGDTTRFLHETHSLIAETTETSARVENALKVTEDVYWNRVYTTALAVLRVDVWRTGIAGNLAVLREAAALLNDEAQHARATLLEWLVIVLIAFELLIALLSLRH